MSQPPQGQPPNRPDPEPLSGDQPSRGGGWGQPARPEPAQPAGSGQPPPPEPTPEQRTEPLPGQGWGQPAGQPAPPPGQGGWGQPTQPVPGGFGPVGQPPYAGGPAGPGGPGWGPPPGGASGQGAGRSTKKRNVIIAAGAALVLIVAAAVVIVVTVGRDDAPGTVSAGSRSSASPPSTFASSAPSGPSSGPSSSPSSSGGLSSSSSAPIDPHDFVSRLPADFTDCAAGALAGDGDLAAASCGAAKTQPGPSDAKFYLYPDVATLNGVFQRDVTDEKLTEFADTADCSTGVGYGPWTYTDGTPGGKVACQVSADGHVLVAWTDEEYRTEGVVRAPGATQAEVSALYDWWTSNSDYRR